MLDFDEQSFHALERDFARVAEASMLEIGVVLEENVSGQGRTGTHHRGLKFASSKAAVAIGKNNADAVPQGAEHPTEQSGDYKGDVDVWEDGGVLKVGFRDTNIEKALTLELGSDTVPARAPLTRTAANTDTHKRANQKAQEAL